MSFGSIISGLFTFVAGGWGSFASIIALLAGAFVIYRAWKKAKEEAAHQQTLEQAAADATTQIINNQVQGEQAALDDKQNETAHEQALNDLLGPRP